MNVKKDLYVNSQKHASIFLKAMLSTINGGGHVRCYVLLTSVCATTNYYLTIEYRYRGLICQHALENILHVSQRFITPIHQPTKPHGLVIQFSHRYKRKKETYGSIDFFIRQLK